MKQTYLAFYKGKGNIANAVIRLFTWSKYSHCELVVGSPDSGTWYSSDPRTLRVKARQIRYNPKSWDLVEVNTDEKSIVELYSRTKNAKYDWLAIFLSVGILRFKKECKYENKDKWICSEWCAEAMGLTNSCKYTPASLARKYGLK